MRSILSAIQLLLVGAGAGSAQAAFGGAAPAGGDLVARDSATTLAAVEAWNDHIATFIQLSGKDPPAKGRMAAMVHIAVHDVLNAVDRRYQPYAYHSRADSPLSIPAAVATAATDVMVALGGGLPTPDALAFVRGAYAPYIARLGSGDEVVSGIELGHGAAAAILAARDGDGSAGPFLVPLTSTGEAGKYRPTRDPSPDGLSGFVPIPYWGSVRPFGLDSGSQFRPPPMYGTADVEAAVRTTRYLADYAEVKRLGGMVSDRTEDQTDIAFFWIEPSMEGWDRIARLIAAAHGLDAWRLARLMAHVAMADADANIASFDAKYLYNFWRPVTAIRLGNLDPATPPDASWEVASRSRPGFSFTPIIPEFNSVHAAEGAAAAVAILANVPEAGAFSMESPTVPGKPRSFGNVREAAQENGDSRLYAGFHFREAISAGLTLGQQVGEFVARHTLLPVPAEGGP